MNRASMRVISHASAYIVAIAIGLLPTGTTGLSKTTEIMETTAITLARFFGDCEQAGVDVDAAVGEACIIQAIINAFSDAHPEVGVVTLPTDWGNYYDRIKALYAARRAPDVFVMHGSSLAEFAGVGALATLTEHLESAGIDPGDWTEWAREAVTYDGEIYGVPMDLHANLWHINLDVLEDAGLVHPDGTPMLPTNPVELLEHAQRVKSVTGHDYLAADFSEFPLSVRFVLALVWQQGASVFSGRQATVDTPEMRTALETIVALFENGYANPRLNYNESQQAFLNGEVAILVNGTWVVDLYHDQAAHPEVGLDRYYAAAFPALFEHAATWADSHMWVIPSTLGSDTETFQGALAMLAWINDHNRYWARTGHLAVQNAVLESGAYTSMPHRAEYSSTAAIARHVPRQRRYAAIQDVLNRELQALWLTGKSIDAALQDAQRAVHALLNQ